MPGFSKRERLSPVDAAWFHMDTPTNMAMITGVMMFSERLDIWRLKQVVELRLLQHERFRQRIHQTPLGLRRPSWEIDPHFDLNAHIRHIALPEPGDVSTLQSLVGDLMGTPLDPDQTPLATARGRQLQRRFCPGLPAAPLHRGRPGARAGAAGGGRPGPERALAGGGR